MQCQSSLFWPLSAIQVHLTNWCWYDQSICYFAHFSNRNAITNVATSHFHTTSHRLTSLFHTVSIWRDHLSLSGSNRITREWCPLGESFSLVSLSADSLSLTAKHLTNTYHCHFNYYAVTTTSEPIFCRCFYQKSIHSSPFHCVSLTTSSASPKLST